MWTLVIYELWTGEQRPGNASHLPDANNLYASVLEKRIHMKSGTGGHC